MIFTTSFLWYFTFLGNRIAHASPPATANLTVRHITCIPTAHSIYQSPPVSSSCASLALRIGRLPFSQQRQIFSSVTSPTLHPVPHPVPYCWTNPFCQITLDFHPPYNADISSIEEIAIQTHLITVACLGDAPAGPNGAGLAEVGQIGVLVVSVSGVKMWPGTECLQFGEEGEGGKENDTSVFNA